MVITTAEVTEENPEECPEIPLDADFEHYDDDLMDTEDHIGKLIVFLWWREGMIPE